jgi:hypothetical protein
MSIVRVDGFQLANLACRDSVNFLVFSAILTGIGGMPFKTRLSFGRTLGSSAKAEIATTVSTKMDFNIKSHADRSRKFVAEDIIHEIENQALAQHALPRQ